jgi:hypothetical protein
MTGTSTQKKWALYLAMILLVVSVLEGLCYSLLWFIPHGWYYRPPTREAFLRYLAGDIDWEVGWRPEVRELSAAGYRLAPAGAGMATPCIALYGDSFTFGYEVPPELAWGNLLTERLGCRVDNYGVIGYGTDQAYLYFTYHQQHGLDTAPVVILSHLSENIVRNITQDMGFIYEMTLALKPRFVAEPAGTLRLVPMPRLASADYDAYRRDMRQFLHAEYLLPSQSVLSKRRVFFPYMITVPYLFTYKRLYASLLLYAFDVPPWFAELYDPTHPSQALQVTRDILVHFDHEAKHYGKRPLIFVLPTARDLVYFQRTRQWSYTSLLVALQDHGVQAMNVGPLLLAKVHDGDLCEYFCTNRAAKSGHYTIKGNKVLAEVTGEIIERLGFVSTIK